MVGDGRAGLHGAVVVFDLDGTLIDTAPDLIGTLNWLLAEDGVTAFGLDEARPFIGRGARWLIERGYQAAGVPLEAGQIEPLFERFIARYNDHIADESRPFPGMVPALESLKAGGAKLAICTNKLTRLSVNLLDALELGYLFDAVIGADAAPAAKPDPRHLEGTIAAAGGSKARAVMVGDAAPDAGAARAAGVPLILVTFGYTETPVADLRPDIAIDHFDLLSEACVRLLGACGA